MVLTKLIARFKSKLDAIRSDPTVLRWLLGFGLAAVLGTTTTQLLRPASQCTFGALTLGRLRDTRDTGGPRRRP